LPKSVNHDFTGYCQFLSVGVQRGPKEWCSRAPLSIGSHGSAAHEKSDAARQYAIPTRGIGLS